MNIIITRMTKPFRSTSVLLCLSLMIGIGPAFSKECTATFKANASAIEDRDSIAKKGTVRTYATQYRVDTRTKDASVCFKGGYCYPANKIKLSCAIDWNSGSSDEKEIIYYFK